jgi:hypothetical protein
MRKRFTIRIGAVAAVAAAAASVAAAASGATAPKSVAFTGTYAGTATAQQVGSTANLAANGTGKGTLLGAGTITGTGTADTSQQPCSPFWGPGTMSGAAGAKLSFTVTTTSRGCGDEQGQTFSLTGKANVTKGTGKLAKAHGTLRFSGVYDRSAGTFSVKFTGTLAM